MISSIEDIKIFADINRFTIMDCLATYKVLTTNEISEKTGLTYAKTSYHLKKLEEADMVKVVDTKVKFGIIEKHYSLAAKEFQIVSSGEDEDGNIEYNSNSKLLSEITLKSLTREFLKNTYRDDHEDEKPEDTSEVSIENLYLNYEEYQLVSKQISEAVEKIIGPYKEMNGEGQSPFTLGKIFFKRD